MGRSKIKKKQTFGLKIFVSFSNVVEKSIVKLSMQKVSR